MTLNGVLVTFSLDHFTQSPPDLVIDNSEVQIVDLQQYTPVGGVFYFDVFHVPPQSHIVKGWEMREVCSKMTFRNENKCAFVIYLCVCLQLLETGLQIFPYPPEQSRVQSSTSVKMDENGAVATLPVGVTVALPDSIMFLEEPQVARWDPIGEPFTYILWFSKHCIFCEYKTKVCFLSYCRSTLENRLHLRDVL